MARDAEHPRDPEDGDAGSCSRPDEGEPNSQADETPRPANNEPIDAIVNPPVLRAIEDAQKRYDAFVGSSTMKAIEDMQKRLASPPVLRAIEDAQERYDAFVGSSTMKAIEDMQKRLASPPVLRAIEDAQKRYDAFVGSSTMKAIEDMQKRLSLTLAPSISRLLDGLSASYARAYETAARLLDREWADRHSENPEHPHPALFVVGSLPMALGYPIYVAAKHRHDDSQLLDLVEPVLTNPDFLDEVAVAIDAAPYITAIAKEHLRTALGWLKDAEYVKAYPPFYNGLESALYSVARAKGLVDNGNNFVSGKGKARKADDLLPHLVSDPRYRRYLRAWIFGDVGNPFRHGDVELVEDCRRQSLRLALAVIGWLEIYGGWTEGRLAAELETQAMALDGKPDDAAA
jgi:hypothetical protein